jgi:hypothetical protein
MQAVHAGSTETTFAIAIFAAPRQPSAVALGTPAHAASFEQQLELQQLTERAVAGIFAQQYHGMQPAQ